MLYCRLKILWDYVDYFILVESNTTHTGIEKPFVFEQHKNLFEKYLNKIIYVKIEDMPNKEDGERYGHMPYTESLGFKNIAAGKRENHQRENGIRRGISQLDISNDDLIISSDLDEIPDPKCFEKIIDMSSKVDVPIYIDMDHIWGDINSLNKWARFSYWRGTAFQRGEIVKNTYDWFLKSRDDRFTGGWDEHIIRKPVYSDDGVISMGLDIKWEINTGSHFSWLGGREMFNTKANSIAHAEDLASDHGITGSLANLKLKDIKTDEQWGIFHDEKTKPIEDVDANFLSSVYFQFKELYYEGNYLNDEKIDNI